MKKIFTVLILSIFSVVTGLAQATNFISNDCNGTSHNLFTELDAGKVIVLCWVMPCATCSGPALTAHNIVQSYQSSHPGRVFFYMVDDYANTNCTALNNWANSINIPASSFSLRFSNAAINMLDYGSTGMPKTVVLGGQSHIVFHNENNGLTMSSFQTAINNALVATSITNTDHLNSEISLYPNPVNDQVTVFLNLNKPVSVKIVIKNLMGKIVSESVFGKVESGEKEIKINTSELANGIYVLKALIEEREGAFKLIITK